MSELSICIVNWNARDYLKGCLNSIFQNKDNLDIEAWVVDNNSSDGSTQMIKKEFPNVNLIENKENVGFARANNQAIKRSKSRYVLLLNPDTIVYKNSLTKLVSFLESHSDAAIVGPKIMNEDGSIQYECARNFPTPLSEFFVMTTLYKRFAKNRLFGHYLMSYWDHNSERDIDCISGSCMMIRRDIFNKIGLLDETFFMYAEDTELCFRVRKEGYKIWYLPQSEITHLWGKSAQQLPIHMNCEARKSMQKFFMKSYGIKSVILYRITAFIAVLFVLATSAILYLFSSKKTKVRYLLILKKHIALLLWALGMK